MSEVKKPSEKVVESKLDGKEVQDASGRKLRLRKPDILDMYDLFSAIGAEDSKNPGCLMLATKVLYVATIDNSVVPSPKSYAEFRATLKRIGDAGILAVSQAIEEEESLTEKEAIANAKK